MYFNDVNTIEKLKQISINDISPMYIDGIKSLGKTSSFLFHDEEINSKIALKKNLTNLKDINYKINSMGFRGEEFDFNTNKNKIIFMGDSVSFGYGINENDSFKKIITEKIFPNHESFNLSIPGNSIDAIVRYFIYLTNITTIDVIFFLLPTTFRTEIPINNGFLKISINKSYIPKVDYKKYDSWLNLNDYNYRKYRFEKNILLIETISKMMNIKTMYSTYDFEGDEFLGEIISNEQHLPLFPWKGNQSISEKNLTIDYVIDGIHPGIKSNLYFSEQCINHIEKKWKI